tara:strand:- start:1090 stop:1455 length:366 start_codon:yes stop_codon:yes gene_type:complete
MNTENRSASKVRRKVVNGKTTLVQLTLMLVLLVLRERITMKMVEIHRHHANPVLEDIIQDETRMITNQMLVWQNACFVRREHTTIQAAGSIARNVPILQKVLPVLQHASPRMPIVQKGMTI